MYISVKHEDTRVAGRPKRDDVTERANLKLNSAIRKLLKNLANMNGRSESAQVERLIIESEALTRLLRRDTATASNLLPLLNAEIESVVSEITSSD
jgi:hypothetical protein